jgi:hypothetical protein
MAMPFTKEPMRHFVSFVSIGLVMLAACAANPGTGDDDDDDPPPPPADVVPSAGSWRYAEVTPVSSTCPAQVQGEFGNFVIDMTSAAGFRVVPADGTAAFSCTLADGAFDCPDRAAFSEDLRPQIDAAITARAVADGSFSSETAGTGQQRATVSCTGSQCAALATFPCNLTVDFAIRKN